MFYPSMIDQYYDVAISDSSGYEYLYGTPTEFSVGPDQFDIDDDLAPISGPSFMYMGDADDEGEFYDPSETGGYAVDLEDFRIDDESEFYDPVAEQARAVSNYERSILNTALRIGSAVAGSGKKPDNRLMQNLPSRRELGKEYGSPVGSAPGRLGLSNLSAEQTRMLQLANFIRNQVADTQTRGNLSNFPLPRIGQTPSASGTVDLSKGGLKPTLAKRRRQTQAVYST